MSIFCSFSLPLLFSPPLLLPLSLFLLLSRFILLTFLSSLAQPFPICFDGIFHDAFEIIFVYVLNAIIDIKHSTNFQKLHFCPGNNDIFRKFLRKWNENYCRRVLNADMSTKSWWAIVARAKNDTHFTIDNVSVVLTIMKIMLYRFPLLPLLMWISVYF